MNSNLDELVQDIYARYDEAKASKIVGAVLQKISQGGNYKNLYEFCRNIGVGDIIKDVITAHDFVMNMDDYLEVSKEFMKVVNVYAKDINDMAELVQKSLNEAAGINIKPQRVKVDEQKLNQIVDALMEGIPLDIEDAGRLEGLNGLLSKFGAELTDEIIQKNAEIQAKSGFDIVLIRKYDDVGIYNYAKYADVKHRKTIRGARVCEFCKEREGVYNYMELNGSSEVWRRHAGCTCSIDYVNEGMTDRVKNYVVKRK